MEELVVSSHACFSLFVCVCVCLCLFVHVHVLVLVSITLSKQLPSRFRFFFFFFFFFFLPHASHGFGMAMALPVVASNRSSKRTVSLSSSLTTLRFVHFFFSATAGVMSTALL